jgi:ubiquinone/menaquinone biosynthesis C-methylase UbiE
MIRRLLRLFFDLLYHQFAFTFDLLSTLVSLGRWKDWVMSVIPFIEGSPVLELGFGPGHLLAAMRIKNKTVLGLDESRQMANLAKRRLRSNGYAQLDITIGRAGDLPFPSDTFRTIVTTFPSKFIFDLDSLSEARRVLMSGGRLIVLPIAWHIGSAILERFMAWLFKATGESPGPVDIIIQRLRTPFERAGFLVRFEQLEVKSSLLLVMIATES